MVKPLREQSGEEAIKARLERCFDRSHIVCKETALSSGISWQEALSVLRMWEYTGQVRRGYFVRGLSGAQFIRDRDYASVIRNLAKPEKKIIWVNAADPVQCWGKILPHKEGHGFLNVPGSVVACYGGCPLRLWNGRETRCACWMKKQMKKNCWRSASQSLRKIIGKQSYTLTTSVLSSKNIRILQKTR